MKILILLLTFYSSVFMSNSEQMPNYNPRSLQINLKRITGCDEYCSAELSLENQESYNSVNGKFFSINCGDDEIAFVYIGRVNSCRAGGCSISRPHSGEFEFFDYFTIYDTSLTVIQVSVYNYEATHGHEITARGWLKQFIGYKTGLKLETGKNIDAISGATISVNGIVDDIKEKTHLLENGIMTK